MSVSAKYWDLAGTGLTESTLTAAWQHIETMRENALKEALRKAKQTIGRYPEYAWTREWWEGPRYQIVVTCSDSLPEPSQFRGMPRTVLGPLVILFHVGAASAYDIDCLLER